MSVFSYHMKVVHSVVSYQQVITARELTQSPRTKLVFLPMLLFLLTRTQQTTLYQRLLFVCEGIPEFPKCILAFHCFRVNAFHRTLVEGELHELYCVRVFLWVLEIIEKFLRGSLSFFFRLFGEFIVELFLIT